MTPRTEHPGPLACARPETDSGPDDNRRQWQNRPANRSCKIGGFQIHQHNTVPYSWDDTTSCPVLNILELDKFHRVSRFCAHGPLTTRRPTQQRRRLTWSRTRKTDDTGEATFFNFVVRAGFFFQKKILLNTPRQRVDFRARQMLEFRRTQKGA